MRALVGKARAGLQEWESAAGDSVALLRPFGGTVLELQEWESAAGDSVALLRPFGGTVLELQEWESATGNLVWVGRVTCGITCIGAMSHGENLHRSTLQSLVASGPRRAVRAIALAMRA